MIKHILNISLLLGFSLISSLAFGEDLLNVYQLASENDPQIRAAAAARDASLEIKSINRAGYLPSVSLNADITSQRQQVNNSNTDSFTTNGYSLNLSQAIYNRDAWLAMRQSGAEIAKAEAEYQAARQTLVLRVAENYFAVLAAADSLEFARAEKIAIGRQLEQTRQRFNVGLTAITDVHEAQARYDLSVAQEIIAVNELDNAREQLRTTTSRYLATLQGLQEETPLPTPEPADIEHWVKTALGQNLDLIALEQGVEIALQNVKRQGGAHHPTLSLVGTHRYSDNSDSNLFGSETENDSLSLQFNWNLYQGGAISAAARQAGKQLEQTRETLEQQRRQVERQTRSGYASVMAGISRVQALKQAVVSSQSALDATQAGQEVGTRTTVDVLNAQQEVFRARRDHAKARYDYILNTLRLKQAAGILADSDLQQINAWLK
ncbi:MAG: hypothetical protein A2V90_00005 [Gammaproteobacteria bacterium RBG_16_57_12]|nr:MAG: hypothetical protein A2V90_00005 [Gammaproteobacteria bacterium RBG_16_57_12]